MSEYQSHIDEYYAALKRLQKGRPERVQTGTRISNDAVALEAGRRKGSIKRSRPQFQELISDIAAAAAAQADPKRDDKAQITKLKSRIAAITKSNQDIQNAFEQSLMRELSLLRKVLQLEKERKSSKQGKKGLRIVM